MGLGIIFALAALICLAACGASRHRNQVSSLTARTQRAGRGLKTFSAPGMALQFYFPANFTLRIARSKRLAGNTDRASEAAVGLGRYDLLIVSRFPHRPIPVTASNLAKLRPQFDAAVSAVLGHKISSVAVTLGGLPALSFPAAPVAGLPVKATSRITDVFVRDDEYELNCQYTAAHVTLMQAACGQMLNTLRAVR